MEKKTITVDTLKRIISGLEDNYKIVVEDPSDREMDFDIHGVEIDTVNRAVVLRTYDNYDV